MFRLLLIAFMVFFIWRTIRSLLAPVQRKERFNKPPRENKNSKKLNLDEKDIDDANFEDIE